jgi:uncharacterized membrane protein
MGVFEHKSEPIVSRARFIRRMAACFGLSLAMIAVSLAIGVCGYHWIAHLPWIDSLLNASMILGGMGPVDRLATSGSKLFASAYAVFSGLMFISVMGVILVPVIHRVILKFHLADEDLNGEP